MYVAVGGNGSPITGVGPYEDVSNIPPGQHGAVPLFGLYTVTITPTTVNILCSGGVEGPYSGTGGLTIVDGDAAAIQIQ